MHTQVLQVFESWAHHIGPDDFSEFAKPCVPPPNPDEPLVQSRSRGLRITTLQKCAAVPRRAVRLLYHSTLGMRVIKKKKNFTCSTRRAVNPYAGGLSRAAWDRVLNP